MCQISLGYPPYRAITHTSIFTRTIPPVRDSILRLPARGAGRHKLDTVHDPPSPRPCTYAVNTSASDTPFGEKIAAMVNFPGMALRGLVLVSLVLININGAGASWFRFVNKCEYTVWPGVLANAGTQRLSTTGFELATGQSLALAAPAGWSGRMWGRTGCAFGSEGKGTCATGDCGGSLECNGMGAAPPATLAEFTLGQPPLHDFYDVSLVDGYNLPMLVTPDDGNGNGNGNCSATGCVADLNLSCPKELRVDGSVACKSACNAFGNPEYCCSGEFGNPHTCKPSKYSRIFKAACPRSYTYAYDDATSTFTCAGADYTVTFCPTVSRQKRSEDGGASPALYDDATWGVSAAADDAATSGADAGFPRWLLLHASGAALWLFLATWPVIFVR